MLRSLIRIGLYQAVFKTVGKHWVVGGLLCSAISEATKDHEPKTEEIGTPEYREWIKKYPPIPKPLRSVDAESEPGRPSSQTSTTSKVS